MWKTFYIKPNELGLLFRQDHFQKILSPGWYRRWPWTGWRVEHYDISLPSAQVNNFELLLRDHRSELEQHLLIVKTAFNEVALVRAGQRWMSVAPNRPVRKFAAHTVTGVESNLKFTHSSQI